MSNPTIEANIYEIDDGPYFQVKLHAIPQVGELIDLYSFVDDAANYPPRKYYEIVQVVHRIHDVSEKISQSKNSSHDLSIYVKQLTAISSEYFD